MLIILGQLAAQLLLRTQQTLGSLRNEWFWYKRRWPARVTFDPDTLSDLPSARRSLNDDLKIIAQRLDRTGE